MSNSGSESYNSLNVGLNEKSNEGIEVANDAPITSQATIIGDISNIDDQSKSNLMNSNVSSSRASYSPQG